TERRMDTASARPSPASESEGPYVRDVGSVRGPQPGPTLIVIGGVHGNEPGGITAARRVLRRLAKDDAGLRGELVVFAGNVAALRAGRRYQVKDLNRQWSATQIVALRSKREGQLDAEDREQLELLA